MLAKYSFMLEVVYHTENLLQLHDTRVGADVVNGRLLPDLTRVIFLLEDIGKGQRLLRCRRHLGYLFFWEGVEEKSFVCTEQGRGGLGRE